MRKIKRTNDVRVKSLNLTHKQVCDIILNPFEYLNKSNAPKQKILEILIKQCPENISLIDKPSEKLQKLAVGLKPSVITLIKNPKPNLQMFLATRSISDVRHIKKPCVELQNYIVENYPYYCEVLNSVNRKNQIKLANNGNINHCRKPLEDVLIKYVEYMPSRIQNIKPEFQTKKVQFAAIKGFKNQGASMDYALSYINVPCDELKAFQ